VDDAERVRHGLKKLLQIAAAGFFTLFVFPGKFGVRNSFLRRERPGRNKRGRNKCRRNAALQRPLQTFSPSQLSRPCVGDTTAHGAIPLNCTPRVMVEGWTWRQKLRRSFKTQRR